MNTKFYSENPKGKDNLQGLRVKVKMVLKLTVGERNSSGSEQGQMMGSSTGDNEYSCFRKRLISRLVRYFANN
jgi:hypothetical protein